MKIKRNVSFKLRAYGKNNDLFQIRLRTTFNSQRLDLKTGCQINKKSAWDEEAELVKTGYKGPKGETALSINNELRNIKDQMESTFKFFEAIVYHQPPIILSHHIEVLRHTFRRVAAEDVLYSFAIRPTAQQIFAVSGEL